MEKLTTILAVSTTAEEARLVRARADALAARFHAHVVALLLDSKTDRRLHERILDYVKLTRADLVIKAPAGPRSLRRFTMGESDWDLARDCPVPLLLARAPTWADPVRIAAAVNVADEEHNDVARAILHAAGFLALGTRGQLDILYSESEDRDEPLRMQRAVRLAQLVREFHVGCERIQMFSGEPERRLAPLLAARKYCMVVVGGRSRRRSLAQLAPGVVSRFMEATDSDILLVNETAPEAPEFTPRAAASGSAPGIPAN
jgi:nucleotide-binding universal stress UspA family protein